MHSTIQCFLELPVVPCRRGSAGTRFAAARVLGLAVLMMVVACSGPDGTGEALCRLGEADPGRTVHFDFYGDIATLYELQGTCRCIAEGPDPHPLVCEVDVTALGER